MNSQQLVKDLTDDDLDLAVREAEVIQADQVRRRQAEESLNDLRQEQERRNIESQRLAEMENSARILDNYATELSQAIASNNLELTRSLHAVLSMLRRRTALTHDVDNAFAHARRIASIRVTDPLMPIDGPARQELQNRGLGFYPLEHQESQELLRRIIDMAANLI